MLRFNFGVSRLAKTLFVLLVLSNAQAGLALTDDFPPTQRYEVNTQWELSGVVTNSDQKPVAGVKVFLSSPRNKEFVTTNRSGEYKLDVNDNFYSRLNFIAPGYAPYAATVPDGSKLDVELTAGRSISGTLLLPTGEPAVGVIVTPNCWHTPFDKSAKEKNKEINSWSKFGVNRLPDDGKPFEVKTDIEGGFKIDNLPDFRVALVIQAPDLKEEVIYVNGAKGPSAKIANVIQVENDFIHELKPCALLKLTATNADTGAPARVAKVHIQPRHSSNPNSFYGSGDLDPLRTTVAFNAKTSSAKLLQYDTGLHVFVEPEDPLLLGVEFEMPKPGETEVIEKEIKFSNGKMIRGIVKNSKDDKPLEGVRIAWRTKKSMKGYDGKGNFVSNNVTTDQQGRFKLVVPDVDGIFGVIGEVPGHTSIYNWNKTAQFKKHAPELTEKFTRALYGGEIDEDREFEFILNPSFRVEVTVVDSDKQPVANCVVATQRHQSIVFNNGYRKLGESQTSDKDGRVYFENWYDDAYLIALGKKLAEESDPAERQQLSFMSAYPSKLQAFSPDGFLQGAAMIPIPDPDSETEIIPVMVELLSPGNVIGQIVDTDGKGIGGLEISVSSGKSSYSTSGQAWKTKTRSDGWFQVEGLMVGGELHWKLDKKRVKTENSGGVVKIDTSDLQHGETLRIVDPVMCVDYTQLLGELPEITIEGLENEAALKAIAAYIDENIQRMPFHGTNEFRLPPEIQKFFTSSSSDDPGPVFHQRISDSVFSKLKLLADREPGSEFEFKVIDVILSSLEADPGNFGMGDNQLKNYCYERLFKNHIKSKYAQSRLLEMSSSGFHFDQNKAWLKLANASPFTQTKEILSKQIVSFNIGNLVNFCREGAEQKQFETLFKTIDEHLSLIKKYEAENEGQPADSQVYRRLPSAEYYKQSVEFTIKMFETLLNPDSAKQTPNQRNAVPPRLQNQNYSKVRMRKVLDRLKKHVGED